MLAERSGECSHHAPLELSFQTTGIELTQLGWVGTCQSCPRNPGHSGARRQTQPGIQERGSEVGGCRCELVNVLHQCSYITSCNLAY